MPRTNGAKTGTTLPGSIARVVRRVALVAICVLSGTACSPPQHEDEAAADAGSNAAPYALFAVQPATARVNDTITLEGTFASTATVHFPGGASVPASILGPHRASVVVPPSATTGDLTVTAGDVVVGPLAFHAAPFSFGLGNAAADLEQADGARRMPSLVIARREHASVVIGRHVYVIGGADKEFRALNSVEQASIAADGSLGPFTVLSDTTLATARYGHTAVMLGKYLYVIGGVGEISVERAAIRSDGSLDKFAIVVGVVLPIPRGEHASAVVGSTLYVIGGRSSGDPLSTVARAPIATDGALGAFTTASETALVVGRHGTSATMIANWLYIVGGYTRGGPVKTIERAAITGDGALGPFAMVDATLSTERYGHTATVLGDSLYIQGGFVQVGLPNHIERSPLGVDGSLGVFTFAPRSTMATVRGDHTSAIIGNYLYVLGGIGDLTGALSSVERATIITGGGLATFDAGAGSSLQIASESHTSAVVGNRLYVFGGGGDSDVLKRIERADIAPDGTLGPFTQPPRTALSMGRYHYACAVAGEHVYLIGGRHVDGSPSREIDESVAAADGTLGFLEPAAAELQLTRYSHTAVTIGNHLYVIGGAGSATSPTTVEHAAIAADGSLGPFAIVSGVTLPGPRAGHTSVVLGRFVYNVGGLASNSALATVERAAINADGSLGPFAVVQDVTLVNARFYHASVVVGNYLYILGGEDLTKTLDSVERSSIGSNGSLGPFDTVPGVKLVAARSGPTAVALAGQVYVLGGRGPTGRLTSVERAALVRNILGP